MNGARTFNCTVDEKNPNFKPCKIKITKVYDKRNAAVLSHAEYVPTLTAAAALRINAALSKAAW